MIDEYLKGMLDLASHTIDYYEEPNYGKDTIDKCLTKDEQAAIIGPIDISNQMKLCEAICGAYKRLVTETINRMSQLRGQQHVKDTLRKTLYAAQQKIEEVIRNGGAQ